MMNVRIASPQDAEGLAVLHVNSWKASYQGIISDEVLSNLSIEGRKKKWEWIFENLHQDETIYVIEMEGMVMGFIDGGKSREAELDYDAEIYSFYLLKEIQRRGHGKLLFHKLVEKLRSDHYHSMMVWVLEANPSLEFYKRMGGQYIAQKEITIGGETLIEVALGWDDLSTISVE
ncbi:GNAT family N-acetyltransferase [Paenibacillus sp. SC116]|uniref:GNAT family N-acetyltransferase n=1 Tax=Paenibacillus sp. SC116 TaxID=2968986 RepID=UPI00215B0FDF|nr:GNAT family N-acetyltransferase [Paenibacillus sp. SC116]MCR8843321.1 GNAT family N-acetyltransferase [Paenibacillus sp. SC116]